MRSFIVGINGFVGQHLAVELAGHGYNVFGMDVTGESDHISIVNILDREAVHAAVSSIQPDCVFHLAAQASVARSWLDPQQTFDINVKGALNLLDAVRLLKNPARVLILGSSDQYGMVRTEDCPISEDMRIDPRSPYAISKQAQESMARAYIAAYDMDIVLTRSFNHIGPGQRKGFVIADFASQIAAIEKGNEPVLSVGNLDARRDFTDVRDVVRAYRMLCENGHTGEIYNVGSGFAYSIEQLLQSLLSLSKQPISVQRDPHKMRPSDLPLIQCDNRKLIAHTGWSPEYDIQRTLLDTLNYWRGI